MTGLRNIHSLPGLFAIALCGCSSPAINFSAFPELNTINNTFVKTHQQTALKYESEGALNEARREWKIIDAIRGPESSRAHFEIVRLERMVALRVKQHFNAALLAEGKADYKTAQIEFLKALALKPDNVHVVSKLKSMVGRRSYANLALAPLVSDAVENKVDIYIGSNAYSENDEGNSNSATEKGSIPLPLPSKKPVNKSMRKFDIKEGANNIQRGQAHLMRKEYKLALHYFLITEKKAEVSQEIVNKYLAETRQALAKQHYDQGVILFRAQKYDKAAENFEQALNYVPNHQKARFYLLSTKALQ